MLFNFGMSFAYWASSISGDNDGGSGSVILGNWYDGIPIYTIDELIDVMNINGNTNTYVLARDLDFQNLAYPTWNDNKNTIFSGSFDGNGKTISNLSLTDYRGFFGILEGATIKNLTLDNVNINYTLADNTTSGILAGRIQGTGNVIENIRIKNSSGTNTSVFAGAVAGYVFPTSGTGTLTMSNVKVTATTITGGYSGNTYGNGGLIGTIGSFTADISDVYVEATVTSNSLASSGGIIGAVLTTTTVNIDRAVVFSNISVLSTTNDATVGAGGLVGRNQGTMTADDTFYTGFLRSYVTSANTNSYTVRSGILRATGNNITFTNSRSAQITIYRRASNPSVLINSSTLYNKLTGQKATYSTSVYQTNRSSLSSSWWTTNYNNITSLSGIWQYNSTTYLYELID